MSKRPAPLRVVLALFIVALPLAIAQHTPRTFTAGPQLPGAFASMPGPMGAGRLPHPGPLTPADLARMASQTNPIGSKRYGSNSSDPANPIFFTAPTYDSGGRVAFSVAVGDVNGDGKPDMVVANLCDTTCASGSVGVLLGNGDGTFQTAVTYGSGGVDAFSVALGDVNGDGKPDVVVANQCVDNSGCVIGSVGVLLGNGDGTLQAAVSNSSGGRYAISLAVGDVNGDGKADLVVADQCDNTCATGLVAVLVGNGDGTFQVAVSYGSGGSSARSVAVGDVNRDGKPDVVVANQCVDSGTCANGSVGVLLGNGDGTLQAAVSYGSGGLTATSVVVGDVNGDGNPDVVVANQCVSRSNCTSGLIGVLLGNGDGTVQTAVSYGSGGRNTLFAAVGDVNGDGKLDVEVVNQCADNNQNNCPGLMGVLLGNGDGTFQAAVSYGSGGSEAISVALGDVNRDGKLDALVANECVENGTCANGSVGVLLGNGDGTLQAAVTYGSGGRDARSVAVGDVNGDGNPDVVVANRCADGNCANGSVGVLLGNGDGTFQAAVTYGSGGVTTFSVAVGDVNGDGKLDVVVANECVDENCANGSVSVLLGNGDGTLQTAVGYGSGGIDAYAVALGDVNGDGNPDMVVANYCNSGCAKGSVGVLLGNGDGTFQAAVSSDTAQFQCCNQSLALADFNGDGKLDAASGVGNVLLLGNGDGTLQSPLTLSASGAGMASGDFNHDGKPDLAVVGGTTLAILRNISAGAKTATTTTVNSSVNPSSFDQSVTFTATVTFTDTGTPTGTVTFYDGADSIGTGAVSAGVATLSTPNLLVGSHSISAIYAGDSGFLGSTSSSLNQEVDQTITSVALASDVNPSGFGQTVVLTATVSSQFSSLYYWRNPSGTVTFYDSQTVLGTSNLNASTATLSVSTLGLGSHSITAAYSGNANFLGSTSNVLSQTVNPAATTTTLGSSLNPTSVGQPVTFTATVMGAFGGTPSGSVTFTSGPINLGSGTLSGGQASVTVTINSPGTRSITATYSGDGSFTGSTSAVFSEGVTKATSTTALTTSLSPSGFNQTVTFTATVTSAAGNPANGELVTFTDGTTTLGTSPLHAGVATITTSSLTVGVHHIKAAYAGDAKLKPSAATLSQAVNRAASTTGLVSSQNPSPLGQSVTFTATITGQYGGTPSGTVTFKDGTTILGTGTLSLGIAVYSTSTLAHGSHHIVASYGGDGSFKTSSASLTQVVH